MEGLTAKQPKSSLTIRRVIRGVASLEAKKKAARRAAFFWFALLGYETCRLVLMSS